MTSLPKLTKQVMTGAAFCCTLWLAGCAQQQPAPVVNLIPKPVNLTLGEGYFRTDSASICDGAENIRYVINPDMKGEEAYQLTKGESALIAASLPNPRRFNSGKPSPYMRRRQAKIMSLMDKILPVDMGYKTQQKSKSTGKTKNRKKWRASVIRISEE